jgi:FkbM family methyltransferase
LRSIFSTLRFIAKHPLSSQRPVSSLYRYARWQIESRLRKEVEFKWICGAKLIARSGMTGATGNIYCGLHEFADMAFLLHLLRPEDLFVDIGANIGSYTVLASAVCRSRSISFEPDPGTMRSLQRNIEANQISDRVTLYEAAVGSQSGTVHFTTGQDTTNRVTSGPTSNSREVAVLRLDEVLANESPVLLKVDVEGYEPEVVEGTKQTLMRPSLAAVIIETVDPDIKHALKSASFRRAIYDPISRRLKLDFDVGSNPHHNSLFVRPDLVFERVRSAERRSVVGVLI